ncbi:5-formyltetrahydrofolate cyclo-ligase [Bacillus rubiinfantis]|uniref:5-formyltetrahydrofolate cyclo-ligase n=1 Tax=Bacillus rubiinfantis TaxID=1499680 RepID=UPI0016524CE1|nr:5-formyltetrahydrofolate cyclo-ligase [Bacillus rubiinfantis]
MDEKKLLRKQVKEVLSQISKPVYEDYSYKIACTLFEDERWKQATTIGLTVSNFPEVDTFQIIRKAWETGKKVVVPKCDTTKKTLSFRMLTKFSQLESVYYGLWEPVVSLTTEVFPAQIDLLLVPGLAYSRSGSRLGFGGGYYDRFLALYSGPTVSLAFDEQIIPHIPVEQYDLPVAQIITPSEVIKIV